MSCNTSTDIWKTTLRDWAKASHSLSLHGIEESLFLSELATFPLTFKIASLLWERVSRAGDKSKTDPMSKITSQKSSAQQRPCAVNLFQLPPDISSSAQHQNYSSQYWTSHSYQRLAKHLEIRWGSDSLWKCLLCSELHLTNLQDKALRGWGLSSLAIF